ncbi:hypothetical protein QYM36_004044 [Artemia franciscana]|uniref:Reverse transcriptase domain-containing protein n=1 Tax=Artemia franciscana TaxID=6661 RepID=A0AA88IFJ7_ARTSF|nr:hypothetical protein QYM36_004044 [Artemia franciscana]
MSVIYETRISSRCVQIEDYGLTHFRFEALLFTAFSGAYYSITILGLEARSFSQPWTDPVKQLITAESVARSLSGLSGSKSGGLDGVTANHIKHGGPSLICLLTLLFGGFLNRCYVPDSLAEVCLVPIPKSNASDMASLSNYRQIALAAAISKLFEKCLYSLISPQIDSSYYQFGFKEGSSTEFCVFILKSVVQYFWIFSSPVFACFTFAKAAFDRHFKIKWSGYFSESFPVLNCVRQGGVLSPLLYDLYVDDLNLRLAKTGVGCFFGGVCFNNLSYADDLVILAPTVAALNHLLSICDELASANDIVFNTAKTQCMGLFSGELL